MMAATNARKLSDLSGDELTKLLGLIGSSDSVELKVTFSEQEQQATIAGLGLDPLEAQIRQVFFFDTPDLLLNRAGVAVRARRVQGRSGDAVVKLRPVVTDDLSEDIRRSASVNVEVDATPKGYVCSASMRGKVSNDEVRDTLRDRGSVRKLFSKEQRAFYVAHAPEGLGLDDLSVLGPVFVLKQTLVPAEYGRQIVAELWLLPDGSRILEVSTKCTPAEAFQVAVETRAHFQSKGLDPSGDPQMKTKTSLDFFAAQLAETRT
jgi:hypothetical protein